MTSNVNDAVLQDGIMQFAACEAQEAMSQDLLLLNTQEIPVVIDVATTDVDDQARVRQQISALQITPNFTPRQILLGANTPVLQHKKTKKRRATIEWTPDALNLAVRVIYTIQLWNTEARKVMKVMETRDRGVKMFIANMEHQLGVNMQSKPVWGTIENAVNKVLDLHQTQRNKEKNRITGGGDSDGDALESDEERRKRMDRQRFYDKMLSIRQDFQDWKQVAFIHNLCFHVCV